MKKIWTKIKKLFVYGNITDNKQRLLLDKLWEDTNKEKPYIRKNIKFELSEEQTFKYNQWRSELKKVDYGAIGGGFSFIFIPTGIGEIVKVRRDDGQEIDLSEDNW
jgi:hypothetical protein